MAETLYATSFVTGDCPNPANANGAPDGSWAGPAGSGTDWAGRWAIGDPVDPLTESATQTVTVKARKTNHATDPTIELWLYENSSLVATLLGPTAVSSTTGTDIQVTFNTSQVTDPSQVEIHVRGTVGGGKPADRASLQVDAITWTADTTPQGDPVETVGGALAVSTSLDGTVSAPVASVPSVGGSLGVTTSLAGTSSVPTATVEQVSGSTAVTTSLAGSVSVPAPAVPAVGGDRAVTLSLTGAPSVPVASIPQIDGSRAVTLSLSGTVALPSVTPEAGGTKAVSITTAGSVQVPLASVPQVDGSFAVVTSFAGTVNVPVASVPQISGGKSVSIVLAGSVALPGEVVVDPFEAVRRAQVNYQGIW